MNGFTISEELSQENGRNDVLDTIDELRSWGISHYIDLPQVIVCGDQSSGKSSVLEALSNIQFPRKDNLCTRFATEVILRRSTQEATNVSIVPGTDRSNEDKASLRGFQHHDVSSSDFESVVDRARAAMGIDDEEKRFANDILRVEVSGPTQPHLTLVDLPGLFRAGTRSQSDEDAEAITSLVLSYMRKTRSIILAVVSAKNDLANQIVTKYAREIDPDGMRTLGIITKPDTLFEGSDSESSFFELASNRDIHFRHGWHVLRNRDYDTRHSTSAERLEAEQDFFSKGVWATLSSSQTGITTLKPRLSTLLRQQILTELPSLIKDVEGGIGECEVILKRLGEPRATVQEQRFYLLRISQVFTALAKAAIDGVYTEAFFGDALTQKGYAKRLRSVVQNTLIEFSSVMREQGHAKHIVDGLVETKRKERNPRLISRDAFVEEVLNMMRRTRGRELPGTYNPGIIRDLFHIQARPWSGHVEAYTLKVWNASMQALTLIISENIDSVTAANLKKQLISPAMAEVKQKLAHMTVSILEPHKTGHPITYNHYFTENVQRLRIEHRKRSLITKLDEFLGTDTENGRTFYKGSGFDVRHLLESITSGTIADMDRYACLEAVDCMRAYYKVAMKTVVDDVSVLGIERCLMQELPSIFCPELVASMEDETISSIAAETDESRREREKTDQKLNVLKKAIEALNQLRGEEIVRHDSLEDVVSSEETSEQYESVEQASLHTPQHENQSKTFDIDSIVVEDALVVEDAPNPDPDPWFCGTSMRTNKKAKKRNNFGSFEFS